jgi:molecular chaperone DnaK
MELGKVIAERFEKKTGFDVLNSPYKQQFMLAVEKAKIELSTQEVVIARKAELVPERHLSLEEEIDRHTFERAIMPWIQKAGTAIDDALKLRGLRPKDINKVLLVGGSSKIPLVRRYVMEKMAGKEPEPFEKVDPMTCVAQGAAIVSAILQGAPGLDNYAYSVKLEHSLSANPINERRQVYLDPIIKRGSDIPCSFTKTYYPVADPAERVVISVYEGDIYDEPDSGENVKLAEIPWEFKPPRLQREAALEVMYEYGDDGILTVQIFDPQGKHKKRFAIQQAGEDQMDAQQVVKMKRINEELVNKSADLENSPEYRDALDVLKKTEKDVIPRVESAEDKRELEELVRQVRLAMGSGDRQKMEAAAAELNDRLLNYAYLL